MEDADLLDYKPSEEEGAVADTLQMVKEDELVDCGGETEEEAEEEASRGGDSHHPPGRLS